MNITIDLETIPGQAPEIMTALLREAEEEKAQVSAPSNYKDPAKIAEFIAGKHAEIDADMDARFRKTALDGTQGQIAVASVAIDDRDPVAFWSEDWATDEPEIIRDLFEYLSGCYDTSRDLRPAFVGHNLVGFDLPFLFKRSIILGIKPPAFIPFDARPWDDTVFDTMVKWAGVGNRVKLDKLCSVLGIAGKGSDIGEDIDGSMVWDYVKAGCIADVATYCNGDVARARAVHRRMTFADVENSNMKRAA